MTKTTLILGCALALGTIASAAAAAAAAGTGARRQRWLRGPEAWPATLAWRVAPAWRVTPGWRVTPRWRAAARAARPAAVAPGARAASAAPPAARLARVARQAAPSVTPHNSCTAIPSVNQGSAGAGGAGGAAGFTINSSDFAYCGTIPASMTCDGHAFGTGTNPNLTWSGAPTGTMSYAIVFKDISLLADTTSSTAETDVNIQHGYHWAMWDIPAATTHLSTGSATGYHSADISGALQWSQRNNYGYFPPCPNPFPAGDARFNCTLTLDSYSYTLYAFSFAHLPSLPAPDLDANGEPTGNYVAKLGRYIESLSALAVTEYRGTSSAWASSFSPPSAIEYRLRRRRQVDGGTKEDGGVKLDGSTLSCLQ